ncbi:unnamed protein product [Agarophyton chilense]
MIIDLLPLLRQKRVVLASQSPRRREILKLIGLEFESEASSFAEDLDKACFENPACYAKKTAEEKTLDVWRKREKDVDLVIGSDTIVVSEGKILEKPKSEADALRMLRSLSGRWHNVVTGVAFVCKGELRSFCEEANVCFDNLTDDMISAYVKTGEPMDKAGAYGIQGRGGAFVKKIDGCYFCVMGLPMNANFLTASSGCKMDEHPSLYLDQQYHIEIVMKNATRQTFAPLITPRLSAKFSLLNVLEVWIILFTIRLTGSCRELQLISKMSSTSSTTRIALRSLGRGAAAGRKHQKVSRSAGRGQYAVVRSAQPAKPRTDLGRGVTNRLAQLNRQPRHSSPQGHAGVGRGETRSATPRSSLAQSVLRSRGEQRENRATMSLKRGNEGARGPRRTEGARRIEDWYSSSVRKEALESMKDLSRSLAETQAETQRPFAWADFESVVEQLPDQHWAEPFVHGVVRNLEANPAVDGKEKERILGSVLQILSDLSSENERYQDAEG